MIPRGPFQPVPFCDSVIHLVLLHHGMMYAPRHFCLELGLVPTQRFGHTTGRAQRAGTAMHPVTQPVRILCLTSFSGIFFEICVPLLLRTGRTVVCEIRTSTPMRNPRLFKNLQALILCCCRSISCFKPLL